MCEKCQKPHNVLLHFEREIPTNSDLSPSYAATTLVSLPTQSASQVLLGTAIVDIRNAKGQYQTCRDLLDSCSQCNAIAEKLANSLGIEKKRVDIRLKGVQNLHSNVKYVTSAEIKSRRSDIEISLFCLVFKKISEPMPGLPLNKKFFQITENISLADPDFDKPAEIDLLIGAEFFYQLLCSGQIRIKGQSAVFQETYLGWILAGRLSSDQFSKSFQSTSSLIKLQELPNLWELVTDCISNIRSKEELACEECYKNTTQREESGRYSVKLPSNDNRDFLGNSRNTALQRFHALERRFEKDPAFKDQHTACIQGYFKESHLKSISNNEPINHGYYLPHHSVVKTSSLTTKTRVIFDGSAKTTTGISLNDSLMVGPTIQEDLFSIITRFRTFQDALTADIEQMYRQILISEEDTCYQKILWRNSPDEPIETYCLNTVTFGTECAPFLAIRTLHQLAEDEREYFPIASTVLQRNFYVDDVLTGASTYQEAVQIRNDLIDILKKGGFNIRK